MIDTLFSINEIEQINNCFFNLKNKDQLTSFIGTAELSFNTSLKSILDEYALSDIKEKIKLYCKLYIKSTKNYVKEINIIDSWVVGYSKNNYQGEHSHGNNDLSISGVIYTKVPLKSSPINFFTPNPYSTHICVINTDCVSYQPSDGMLLLFPSFLKHLVQPNKDLQDSDLRICLAFNAMASHI